MFSRITFKLVVIGTASNIPAGPQSQPQKNREIKTTSRDKLKVSLVIRGSSSEPVMFCKKSAVSRIVKAIGQSPN